MFGRKKELDLVSEMAPIASFVLAVNICRKLNIQPEEFDTMIEPTEEVNDYMARVGIARLQRKIKSKGE